jgi:hypothetical protein
MKALVFSFLQINAQTALVNVQGEVLDAFLARFKLSDEHESVLQSSVALSPLVCLYLYPFLWRSSAL